MAVDHRVTDFYAARLADLEARRDAAARVARRVSRARLLVFVAAVALALVAAREPTGPSLRWLGAVAAGAGFAALVVRHGRVRREHERARDLALLNRDALHRAARDWSAIEARAWTPPPADHPYADDLDVFGPAGLVRLFPPVSTVAGQPTLRAWLLAPAPPDAVAERQAAIAELAPRVELRDELAIRGRRVRVTAARAAHFMDAAEDGGWLLDRAWVLWSARLLPVATVALVAAQLAGLTARAFWWIPVLAGAALTAAFRTRIARTLDGVVPEADMLAQLASLFETAGTAAVMAPLLRRLQGALHGAGGGAHQHVARLRALADAAETRRSPMLHVVVQLVTLWDFHVVALIEAWQRRAGREMRSWTAALGEIEALAAVGALAHDNPAWPFPEPDAGAGLVEAEGLAHPLLAPDVAVPNDVVVGPPGRFLLVTGSNMAGKSTLIRAIGLNVVLAQCGAPVCARRMRCPAVTLHTSIRVHDSLERGVSYFMAELERLKVIVDASRDRAIGTERTLLYLLDEILQGTNSAERTIAARRVISHLVEAGAIGAVTTHDLALATADGAGDPAAATVARAAVAVHFAEQFRDDGEPGPRMTFDYALRPGVATSTNALKLLEIVGLSA